MRHIGFLLLFCWPAANDLRLLATGFLVSNCKSAINPSATASQIKSAILNAEVATSSLSGKTVTGDQLRVSSF